MLFVWQFRNFSLSSKKLACGGVCHSHCFFFFRLLFTLLWFFFPQRLSLHGEKNRVSLDEISVVGSFWGEIFRVELVFSVLSAPAPVGDLWVKPIWGGILGMFLLEHRLKNANFFALRKDVQRRHYRSNSSKNQQKCAFLA
jgi:hypothetical protein